MASVPLFPNADNPIRRALYESTDGKCWYCGCDVSREMIIEHQTPTFLVPACRSCNSIKGNRTLAEFRAYLQRKKHGAPNFNRAQLAYLAKCGFVFPGERHVFYAEREQ